MVRPEGDPCCGDVRVRKAAGLADLARCMAIRMSVFVDEQRCPVDEEVDGHDALAVHLVAECGGGPVGTARVVWLQAGARIGRVAVLAPYRGRGVGRALMLAAIGAASAVATEVWLDAQVYVIPFYESLGFVAGGDTFLDAGIPHRRMWLRAIGSVPEGG